MQADLAIYTLASSFLSVFCLLVASWLKLNNFS
jgi:hypothetical protein